MKIEEKFVDTKFGKICYLEAGEGEKTVVLLHGGMGTPLFGGGIINYLADLKYKVISPYLPGHGKSFSLPNEYNFSNYVETMAEFLTNLNINNPYVIGHSFGGAITVGLSLGEGLEVKKFLAMAPNTNGEVLNLFTTAFFLAREVFSDKIIMHSVGKEFFKTKISKTPIWRIGKIWNAVKSVKVDAVGKNLSVIWGKADTVLPYPTQGTILEKFIKIDLVPGNHYWFLKHKSLFYEKVLKFLEE